MHEWLLKNMQDGTSLISIVSHLKDKVMQIVSDLGTSVDSTPAIIHEDSNMESQVSVMPHACILCCDCCRAKASFMNSLQNVSYTARSLALKELVYALEERLKHLV